MALLESQATLHCPDKATLYTLDMTLGKRIKIARERLRPKVSQKKLGEVFDISDKAVSAWERDETIPEPDKMPTLRRSLQVPYWWLLEGSGPPPPPDDVDVRLDGLNAAERAAVKAMIEAFHSRKVRVA